MGKNNKSLSFLGKPAGCAKYIPPPQKMVGSDSYYGLKPSWRFSEAWKGNPGTEKVKFFGAEEIYNKSRDILVKLSQFEGRTWSEILLNAKKANHSIAVRDLAKEAQRILAQWQPNLEDIVSLRFTGEERIFGKIDGATGSFVVLFWDPDHKICPSHLKHT